MTPPFTLRPHTAADVDAMVAAVRESIAELSSWMPWCNPTYGSAEGSAWIKTTLEGHIDGTQYNFAIVDDSDRYLGTCGINQINQMNRVANVGYWMRSSCTGRGIAPAAVRQLVAWAFANTPLQRLEIVVAVGNLRSQRVAEKAGGHRDAVLGKRLMLHERAIDAVLYSFLRPDPPASGRAPVPTV